MENVAQEVQLYQLRSARILQEVMINIFLIVDFNIFSIRSKWQLFPGKYIILDFKHYNRTRLFC